MEEESQEYYAWRLLNAASQVFQLSVLGFSFQLRNCFLFPLLCASGSASQALVEVTGWADGLECRRFRSYSLKSSTKGVECLLRGIGPFSSISFIYSVL